LPSPPLLGSISMVSCPCLAARKTLRALCSSLLFGVPFSSIHKSLVFQWLIAGGDWKQKEVVLFLCSEVLLCSLLHLCACVVLSDLVSVHRGLVLGLPAARCSSSRAGVVDVSFGSGSSSSISVNLPPCRPGRGRRNWFSGTEPCVR
jgi:hypothetical protein